MDPWLLRLHAAKKNGGLNPKFSHYLHEADNEESKQPTQEELAKRADFFKIRDPKDFFKCGEFSAEVLSGMS